MTAAITGRRASILSVGLLAALFLSGGRVEAQAVQVVPSPDLWITRPPVPVTMQIYLFDPRPSAPAQAPQPLVCPRHTKWRIDCTPVPQH